MSAPNYEIAAYARRLAEWLRDALRLDVPAEFESRFLFNATRLGPIDYEDLGSCLLVECCEAIDAGQRLSAKGIVQILDRIRHRIVRASHKELSNVRFERWTFDAPEQPQPAPSLVEELVRSLDPESATILELCISGLPVSQIAKATGISTSTAYRRIRDICASLRRLAKQHRDL